MKFLNKIEISDLSQIVGLEEELDKKCDISDLKKQVVLSKTKPSNALDGSVWLEKIDVD
jgi:hypothetical protein